MGFFACGLGAGAYQARPVVDWEEPRCLLCNSDRASILLEAPDPLPLENNLWFAVAQCQDCGLCYTCPRPGDHAIGQFYPASYPPHHKATRDKSRHWWRRFSVWHRSRPEPLEGMPPHGQGRLLDFGCGTGTYLQRMRHAGWRVTGLDPSEEVVQRIRNDLGLPALIGSLPHAELGDNSFDVITMRHSLEHVHRPLDVLRAAHRLLAPDGKLIVSTPNIDSLPYKWFGRHWIGLDLPRHLTHFTPDTLQLMLARAGFDAGPVRMVRHTEWVRRSAQRAVQRSPAAPWQRWMRSRVISSLAMWYAYLARRCDGMVVSATKTTPIELEAVPALSQQGPRRPRSPADRWRST